MASYQEKYPPEYFRKNTESQSDRETSDEESDSDTKTVFQEEDRIVAKLYRGVVDDMMNEKRIKENEVLTAVGRMMQEIHQGHKKGFRRFLGIDFNKTVNRCAYLRRYAICHTGLAKMAVWKVLRSYYITDILFKNDLKVVSLGGGPGNDLVGFCSAVQDSGHDIERLDLKIVDINQGWVSVFPTILKKTKAIESGSLGKFLKTVHVTTSFMQANLIEKEAFDDVDLNSILFDADVILMVKMMSFISDLEAEDLLMNVAERMKLGAKLIFIDFPYDKKLFNRIPELYFLYREHLKYEISFDPKRYNCPSIDASTAEVAVFRKGLPFSEDELDSTDYEDSSD